MTKRKILFLCTHNSSRSQMAEGLVNHFFKDRALAFSAGSMPTQVNPYTQEVMAELGIDLSQNRAKPVSEFYGKEFDYVITLCEEEPDSPSCPIFLGKVKERLHWHFPDPAYFRGSQEQTLSRFREVRDQIRNQLESFFKGLQKQI